MKSFISAFMGIYLKTKMSLDYDEWCGRVSCKMLFLKVNIVAEAKSYLT